MSHEVETTFQRGSSSPAGRRTQGTRNPLVDVTTVSLKGAFGYKPLATPGESPTVLAFLAEPPNTVNSQAPLGSLPTRKVRGSMETPAKVLRGAVERGRKDLWNADVPMDVDDVAWSDEAIPTSYVRGGLTTWNTSTEDEAENAPLPMTPYLDGSGTTTAFVTGDRSPRKRSREPRASPERTEEKRRRSLSRDEVHQPMQELDKACNRLIEDLRGQPQTHPDDPRNYTSYHPDVTHFIDSHGCVAIPVYPTPGNVFDRLKIFRKKYAPPVVSSPLNPARDELLPPEAVKIHYKSVFPRLGCGQTSAYQRAEFEPRSWSDCMHRQCRSSAPYARASRPCWKCEHTSLPQAIWRRAASRRWAEQLASDESLEELFRDDGDLSDDEADYSDAYIL